MGEINKGVIFIPKDRPYLDFVTDFGFISKEYLNFLGDGKKSKMLWELALEISVLSYYYHHKSADEKVAYLDEIDDYMKSGQEKGDRLVFK